MAAKIYKAITKAKYYFFYSLLLVLFEQLHAQTTWTKHPTPVLSPSQTLFNWDAFATADAFVMNDDDTLKMWYAATGWVNSVMHVRIGYAWSLNGINWNQYSGNPVLDVDPDTARFDSDGIETPTVIKDLSAPANQRYKLWYAGRKSKNPTVLDHKLGYAYSPDGINWTKYPGNPVLVPGNNSSWYNTFLSSPSVIKEGTVYKMWFTTLDAYVNGQPTDGKGNIGYATSSNGINWSVHPAAVLIAGDQNNWDSASAAEPSVLKIGNTYHMFYSALDQWTIENFQVGYAHSTDGINWTKSTLNPVLKVGTAGQWDRYWASHPTVMYDSTIYKFKMWYTGRDTANIKTLTDHHWDIGYAESNYITGVNWNISYGNLQIFPNPSESNINIVLPDMQQHAEVIIYDMLGKEVLVSSSLNINIYNLQRGIYILLIKHGENSSIQKLVKQ